jgi:diguanylate cyclase (GGDEF)-like protein/PAS domain S-box-containing protein
MSRFPVGEHEQDRIRALTSFGILDTPPSPAFDALVSAASTLCEVPISLISLIDSDRQWFKAEAGLPGVAETPREHAFCAHAIAGDDVFEIVDAYRDERFATNPLVLGDPKIRFYAGAPIVTSDGYRLGTICVIDTRARSGGLTGLQRTTLQHFARVAMALIEEEGHHRDELSAARLTLHAIGDAVIATDVVGRVTYSNPAATRLTGSPIDVVLGKPIEEVFVLSTNGDETNQHNPVRECLATRRPTAVLADSTLIAADKIEYLVEHSASPIMTSNGELVGSVLVFRDVTEQQNLQEALEFQAKHDSLTGAHNRFEFERSLAEAIADAAEHGTTHALLYLDLDQFKAINDRLGHSSGDELLRLTARAARSRLRADDMVARLGGDEFGIIVKRCDEDAAVKVAEDLTKAIHELRHSVGDQRSNVGVSIGLVMVDVTSRSVQDVIRRADQACYRAKYAGGAQVRVNRGDTSMTDLHSGSIGWLNTIHQALDEGGFTLYAQPIFALEDVGERLCGMELLVRLVLDEEIHSAIRFMPVAESYRLAERIDRWVIGTALQSLRGIAVGLEQFDSVSINLSAQSLEDPPFAAEIVEMIRGSDIDPSKLCFEITESAAMMSPATAAEFMSLISSLGCSFALDDFGKGFSSFGYLKQLPVQRVKIDGMFITDIADDPANREMARSIAGISRTLGKSTVAECIESAEALESVRELGIEFAQGYHLGRPEPLADFPSCRRANRD